MAVDKSAKILLLGKSGVGKSSFINYFIGSDAAKTGDGRPVTQQITEYEYNGRYPIKLFDSKGLEALDAQNQKDEIIATVKQHNNSSDVFNWFHTIFYCISAPTRSFEPFEVDFIRDLSGSISQNIHIILTQCDCVDDTRLDKLKSFIREKLGDIGKKVHIFEVVSVSKKKRNGDIVQPRGKEELSESVFRLLWQDISSKLSKDYARELHEKLVKTTKDICADVRKICEKTFSLPNLIKAVKDDFDPDDLGLDEAGEKLEEKQKKVAADCDKKYNSILRPVAELFISYRGIVTDTSFVERAKLDHETWFAEVMGSIDNNKVDDVFNKYFGHINGLDGEDDANFWNAVCAFGEAITYYPRIFGILNEFERRLIENIPSEKQIADVTEEKLMEFLDDSCLV